MQQHLHHWNLMAHAKKQLWCKGRNGQKNRPRMLAARMHDRWFRKGANMDRLPVRINKAYKESKVQLLCYPLISTQPAKFASNLIF
uniref:Uncharacterized protein n=1 Tax=Oryza brachyantha TaxID=4533 RepID=J3MYY5_ORYBR